jgi:hypothetical protein
LFSGPTPFKPPSIWISPHPNQYVPPPTTGTLIVSLNLMKMSDPRERYMWFEGALKDIYVPSLEELHTYFVV